jgi:hypothetical protein
MAIEALYDRLSDAMHDHGHAREDSMRLADEARHARKRLADLPTDHTPDPDLQRAFDEARAAVQAVEKVDVEALEMTRFNAQAVVNGARDQVDALGRDIARLEERLARLDLVAEQVQAEREGQARLQGELDEVVVLCDAYHRDGIPSLIVENQALPVIEAEANRILAASRPASASSCTPPRRRRRAAKSPPSTSSSAAPPGGGSTRRTAGVRRPASPSPCASASPASSPAVEARRSACS